MPCPTGSFKLISRGKGQSCMASCAYYSGEKKYSEYECCWKYPHSSSSRVKWVEVMLPPNAPKAYADPQTLWNAVDAAETSVNAQMARSMLFALPRELTDEQNLALVRDFCQKEFVDKGMVCNFFYHDKDDGNPHVHIMLTLRAMDENGRQQGQTKPFVRRHARQRGKRCKRISQKRREINNEHPLHQVTSPLKAFARSEQAARRARPAPRSRGSSWHRTRGDSASPAYPTHDTRRWRSPPRDRPSRARHPARAHRRNHGTTPTRTRRPGKENRLLSPAAGLP